MGDLNHKLESARTAITNGDNVRFIQTKGKGIRAAGLDYEKSEFIRTEMLKVGECWVYLYSCWDFPFLILDDLLM